MRKALPLILLVLTGCPSSGQDANGNAATVQVAPPFSADAAFEHVRTQVGFGPRVAGMPAGTQVLQSSHIYIS